MNNSNENLPKPPGVPEPPPLAQTTSPLTAGAPNPAQTGAAMSQTLPGDAPDDHLPVSGLTGAIDSILRQPRRVMRQLRQSNSASLIGLYLLLALGCGLIYGFVVGTFSGGAQLWAAPVKVSAGILLSALICLPSLYIFSCLAGSPARLVEIVGLVAGLVALMTLLLIGFAPVAWVFSQSTESVVAMGVLHLMFWIVATWFGLRFLGQGFGSLSDRSGGFRVWTILFVLVMLQMTTALRPILGTAPTFLPQEKKFFLTHWADSIGQGTGVQSGRSSDEAKDASNRRRL